MHKYKKKPIVVEAIKFEDTFSCYLELTKWEGALFTDVSYGPICFVPGDCFIETLEGRMTVSEGDYIIKGVNGEFYPCKPDIFEKTYELVE